MNSQVFALQQPKTYICTYVCMYLCMYICMYVRMYVSKYKNLQYLLK